MYIYLDKSKKTPFDDSIFRVREFCNREVAPWPNVPTVQCRVSNLSNKLLWARWRETNEETCADVLIAAWMELMKRNI